MGTPDQEYHLNGNPKVENGLSRDIRVMKFGGTSVGGGSEIRRVTEIVKQEIADGSPVIVVVSAIAGVTNRLVAISEGIENGSKSLNSDFDALLDIHYAVLSELTLSPEGTEKAKANLRQLSVDLFETVHDRSPMTPQRKDKILSFGERMSARIVEVSFNEFGIPAIAVDSTEFLETDYNFGEAKPDMERTRLKADALLVPLVRSGITPVATGFLGKTPDGRITTLGRGSSDLAATLIGWAIGAKEVWIWTDVDGIYTADPNRDPTARIIYQMPMEQADEMAKAGAKVLHSKTLEPLMGTNISLRVKNTFNPTFPGTLVMPNSSVVLQEELQERL